MMGENSKKRGTNYELKKFRSNKIVFSKQFYILHSIFCILFFSAAHAQEIKVHGKFNGDSVKIGKPIEFYLSAHYPENLNILFPDSTFSFAPFELQKKIYFPTQTKNGISKDSVIYKLATYE